MPRMTHTPSMTMPKALSLRTIRTEQHNQKEHCGWCASISSSGAALQSLFLALLAGAETAKVLCSPPAAARSKVVRFQSAASLPVTQDVRPVLNAARTIQMSRGTSAVHAKNF
eukprot:6060125-Amphidinium_carterae.1